MINRVVSSSSGGTFLVGQRIELADLVVAEVADELV